MGAVHSYASPDDFWLKYSVPSIDSITGLAGRKKYKMTKIIGMLRSLKQRVDTDDAALAKKKYASPNEFLKWFSYRKGAKIYPLKNVAHIARLYRKMNECPRFWDVEEDIEEEISDTES